MVQLAWIQTMEKLYSPSALLFYPTICVSENLLPMKSGVQPDVKLNQKSDVGADGWLTS